MHGEHVSFLPPSPAPCRAPALHGDPAVQQVVPGAGAREPAHATGLVQGTASLWGKAVLPTTACTTGEQVILPRRQGFHLEGGLGQNVMAQGMLTAQECTTAKSTCISLQM